MIRALLLVLAFAAPARAEGWEPSLPKVLAAAKKSGKSVIVDFTAPWCYSCYYMEKNVLDRASFWDVARGLELARVDVDQPEGLALKAAHQVRFLPTFLVLDSKGKELGRILGEQREADFVAALKGFLNGGKPAPEDEAIHAVERALQRDDLPGAAAALAKPKGELAKSLAVRSDWKRLGLRLSLKKKPSAADLQAIVELNDGCELAYDLDAAFKAELPKDALAGLRKKLDAWYERRYWVPRRDRCADFRSGVESMAEYYERAGDPAAKAATLDRAATLISSESDRMGLGADRNLDDDRRFFLDAAGKDAELEALYPRLVETYPADYVYAQRFAKWLAAKERWADALPWSEKASKLCYGANRLSVNKTQAEILDKLNRRADAAAILKREIKTYSAKFPKEVKPLEDLLAVLSKTK
ncbi:MAG: thioredoxin family protein [Elusimicrobia bacterium]|nr:thioredoxin family protein [Elusimicrobiota bacterium]